MVTKKGKGWHGESERHKEVAVSTSLKDTLREPMVVEAPVYEYKDETDQIAVERFPVARLKRIGAGSDRIVYDMGDGHVIKIAKNMRGLLQNASEKPDGYLDNLIPHVEESGLDYVVVEKIDIDYKKAKAFLKPLQGLTYRDWERKTSELQGAFTQLGIEEFMNYGLLFADLKRERNWGFRNGTPVLIDVGTLNGGLLNENSRQQYSGEWRMVLMKRRQWKKSQGG